MIVAAIALRVTFIGISLSQLPATGDEGESVLLAKQIAKGTPALFFTGQPYEFPIESYLMAPLVRWMPRDALGARYLPMLLGVLSVIGFCLVVYRIFPRDERWPGVLLVLLPSAYWLTMQVAYSPPLYAISATFAWLIIYVTAVSRSSPHRYSLCLLVGFLSGLAFSSHMLMLPVGLGALAVVALGRDWRDAIKSSLMFVVGAVIGLIPTIVASMLYPGAHGAVLYSHPLDRALLRLWDPMLKAALGPAMGVNPPLFPDFREHLDWGRIPKYVFALIYLPLLAGFAVHRLALFIRRTVAQRWPSLEIHDLFLIATLLALLMFGFSGRAGRESHRYLIVAVWAFPFLICYWYAISRRILRVLVGAIAVAAATFNTVTAMAVLREWRAADFAERVADTPDVKPLLADLRARGVNHCYASFWLSYRITYESDEKIICSAPYNERFFGWPIPYKAEVDPSENVLYVLTQTFSSRLSAYHFILDMERYGITWERDRVGVFQLYKDFRQARSETDRLIDKTTYKLSSSHHPEELFELSDGNTSSSWCSEAPMSKDMWIEAEFQEAVPVHRVTMYYRAGTTNQQMMMRVSGRKAGQWSILADNVPVAMDKLRFVAGHPVYGGLHQTIWFEAAKIEALRIELIKAGGTRCWIINELEIGMETS